MEALESKMQERAESTLSVLLENCRLYCENCRMSPELLTKEQLLWLTKQGWYRSKLKNIVSVQTMSGPSALAFYLKDNSLETASVIAKSFKFNFSLFQRQSFEDLKEVYADAVADDIDYNIFINMPTVNVETLVDATKMMLNCKLNAIYDYIVAPSKYIDIFKNSSVCDGVDLYEAPILLDKESFTVKAVAGCYPSAAQAELPIFMPYMLVCDFGSANKFTNLAMRFGWFDKEVEKSKIEEYSLLST